MDLLKRQKHIIDASEKSIGRIAAEAANFLSGKNKPNFQYHQDKGDFVVIINAKNIKIDSKKAEKKVYYRHSGYRAGLKLLTLKKLLENNPEKSLEMAIYGMLPKNKLRAKMMKRLRIFKGGKGK